MYRKKKCDIRKIRVRSKLKSNSLRLRLSVIYSRRHILVQVIDDTKGHTVASASTLEASLYKKNSSHVNKKNSILIGTNIGKRAAEKGVKKVVLDKGGKAYHGNIKFLADAAREYLDF